MALQKQVVRMSAEGGVDTKTDDKNVVSTKYLELENVRSTKTGAYNKRPGYDAYTQNILNSTDKISSGQAATTFKDELLRYSDNNLYSYVTSENRWTNKGITKFALSEEYSVASNNFILTKPCHDTVFGLTCYIYQKSTDSTDNVEYRIIDEATGSVIFTNTIDSVSNPYVIGVLGKFFIFYIDSGSLKFRTINFSTPTEISSATTIAPLSVYDLKRIGTRIYYVYPGGTGLDIGYITIDSVNVGPFTVTDASSFNVLAIGAEQDSSVRFTYGKTSSGNIKTVLYAADLNYQVHAPVTLLTTTSISNAISIQDPNDTNMSQIYVSVFTDPFNIHKFKVASDGAVGDNEILIYQARIQSKPVALDGKVYFAICKDKNSLDTGAPFAPFRTNYIISEDASFITKFGLDASGFRGGTLPQMLIDGDKMSYTAIEAAEVQTDLDSPTPQVPTTVKKYIADFSQSNNYFDKELGNNLHIAGGILKMYDGDKVVEHGFLETPEAPEFTNATTGPGTNLETGTYQWVTVYAWKDKWGQLHRSAPSLPMTHTVGVDNESVNMNVFTTAFTEKDNVEIELYRTEANGTVFYKTAISYSERIFNDKTVEFILHSDNTADNDLIKNEALYTDGGTLENTPANASKYVISYKSRLVLMLSDGETLQYSKKREQNSPVEFSEELQIKLDAFGGTGVCLGTMDDYIIIFKKRAIFALAGEGPNALGEQDDFREPQLITTDCGCVDPNSVTITPAGLTFKSEKGLYLLQRGFTVQYIGADVEKYNPLTITSATLLPDTNEIRFTTNSDKSLVYDYFHNFWFTDTNINAIDAVVFNGIYHYLRANGELMQETPGLYSDNGSYIKTKLVSSWIQLAGIQGFERFYKMLILGTYKSKHLLKVKFAYDFNPSWVQEATIDAGAVLNPDTFGNDVFGDGSPFGGTYPLYQFRIFPKRQKCESFQFSIEDFKTDDNGEAFSLSNFAAEVGIKPPAYKKSDAKSFAAK